MKYGYIGATQKQVIRNSGIYSSQDAYDLTKSGFFGGSLIKIAEYSVTSGTQITFTDIKEDKYTTHLLTISDVRAVISSGETNVVIRLSNNGGTSYISSGYQTAKRLIRPPSSLYQGRSTSTNGWSRSQVKPGKEGASWTFIHGLGNSSSYSFATTQTSGDTDDVFAWIGADCYPVSEVHNALQISFTGGQSFASCSTKLYGIKKS
tara:strand:- start:6876 stop:7493 length:618 start_codon:yes stop_codon:yes gene_type:complete